MGNMSRCQKKSHKCYIPEPQTLSSHPMNVSILGLYENEFVYAISLHYAMLWHQNIALNTVQKLLNTTHDFYTRCQVT